MARPTSPSERQRQQQQARSQGQRAAAGKARRRRRMLGIIGLVVVLALVLGTVGAVIAGSTSGPDSATPTTVSSTLTPPVSGPTELPTVEPGATLTGPTPCPPEDGSAARTTQFAGPPPTCIDPTLNYQAIVHTNVGDLTLLLSTEQAPETVNNFVVLARYHYFDGQAFAPVITSTLASMSPAFAGSPASPGYSLPSEVPPQGQVRGPYTVSAIPVDPFGSTDGSFFITTFSNAPETEAEPTTFGLVLDGQETMKAINAVGTERGTPTGIVIITGIDITPLAAT